MGNDGGPGILQCNKDDHTSQVDVPDIQHRALQRGSASDFPLQEVGRPVDCVCELASPQFIIFVRFKGQVDFRLTVTKFTSWYPSWESDSPVRGMEKQIRSGLCSAKRSICSGMESLLASIGGAEAASWGGLSTVSQKDMAVSKDPKKPNAETPDQETRKRREATIRAGLRLCQAKRKHSD